MKDAINYKKINNDDRYEDNNSAEEIPTSTFITNLHQENEDLSFDQLREYSYTLPSTLDIFSDANTELKKTDADDFRHEAESFIQKFNYEFSNIQLNARIENALPKIRYFREEQGAIIFEWPFPDYRIGFIIDSVVSDSSWFLVTNKNLEELWVSGNLNTEHPEQTIRKILKYALGNS